MEQLVLVLQKALGKAAHRDRRREAHSDIAEIRVEDGRRTQQILERFLHLAFAQQFVRVETALHRALIVDCQRHNVELRHLRGVKERGTMKMGGKQAKRKISELEKSTGTELETRIENCLSQFVHLCCHSHDITQKW